MKPLEITRTDYTADEMWTFYKKEHDGRMKERWMYQNPDLTTLPIKQLAIL